jgi:flagellum-specific peptidoglycan hydrolase FlgJ
VTNEQRAANLAQIASAAVTLERETGIPAELTTGQCIIESGWLEKCPGNNPFGMKAPASSSTFQILETEEDLTPAQIASVVRSGKRIVNMGPLQGGRRIVTIQDRFMVFDSLAAAFRAYGAMITGGRYFAARWQRYQAHRSLPRLLRDLSGADGEPPYFTSRNYLSLFDEITGQANVKAALAAARAANQ